MTEKIKKLFGTIDATTEAWLFLKCQVELLEVAKKRILEEKEEPWPTIHPLIFAVIDSTKSILTLAQDWRLRDCYVIARVVYETTINICFLSAKGKEAAERMRKHYLQKVYREADRVVKIGEAGLKVKWSGQIDLEKNDELKDAIEKFTREKNKKEIRQWTPENIEKRLEAIGSKYGKEITTDLLFAHISIYRHSSEIIHGTYFGAVLAAGYSSLTPPPKSKKELNIYHQKQLSLLIMMIGASLSALLDVISKEIDISYIVKKSKEATIKLGEVLEWDPLDDSQTSWSVKINNS